MMVYQLNRPEIVTIISYCDTLLANEKLEVYEFGENCDLVLHIYKDEDYNQNTGECNLVIIHTAKNGTFVDDTEDIFVTDGSLERELERINQYKDFGKL